MAGTVTTPSRPIIPNVPKEGEDRSAFDVAIQKLLLDNYGKTNQDLKSVNDAVATAETDIVTTQSDLTTGFAEIDEKLLTGATDALKQKAFRRQKTLNTKFGFWGDVIYYSTTTLHVIPKYISGQSWIGVILNNGEYIESTTAITVTTSDRLDGITNIVTGGMYILYAYKDSGNLLDFAFGWMPSTTFSNANPTNSLTLNTVETQNIGYLFPVDCHLVLWQDNDEWETPFMEWNVTAGTYNPSKDTPKVASRTATALTLTGNLENTNFTASSVVYQADNFKPLQISDGAIASAIGTRGWSDTGLRFYFNLSDTLQPFHISDDVFMYLPSEAGGINWSWDQELIEAFDDSSSSFRTSRVTKLPVDKDYIVSALSSTTSTLEIKPYYTLSYGTCLVRNNGSTIYGVLAKHGIYSCRYTSASAYSSIRGYMI